MSYYVYDIEIAKNFFCVVYYDIKTHKKYIFEVSERKDDRDLLLKFHNVKSTQIGFNNIGFDWPLMYYILTSKELEGKLINQPVKDFIRIVYDYAQYIINSDKKIYSPQSHKQIDLYLIWHFNNKAKRTSLKKLQFFMNWHRCQDLPFKYDELIPVDQFDKVIDYCINDVLSTHQFFLESIPKLKLRKAFSKEYNIDMINFNDPKIGSEIMLKLYSEHTKKDKKWLKNQQTKRNYVKLSDCVPNNVFFKEGKFNALLDIIKNTTLNPYDEKSTKAFKPSVFYKGMSYDYGLGGIHGSVNGIFKSDDEYIVYDWDVASLYPSLMIVLGIYPEHLGIEFLNLYKQILEKRLKSKKLRKDKSLSEEEREKHNVINDGLKLALNATYGKMKDDWSFMHDPLAVYKVTIAGQLYLTMLAEWLCEIDSVEMIQINTDGLTFKIKRTDTNKMFTICKSWENHTGLILEDNIYKSMIVRDVNNYISIDQYDNVKEKGVFEVDKKIGAEKAFHKNSSKRIVPYAVREFYKNGTPIKETIKNHNNIYDFCIGKTKLANQKYILVTGEQDNLILHDKIIRYYVSSKGRKLFKSYNDGRIEAVDKGFKVKLFMDYIEQDDYNIDYNYYINECNKLIDNIEKTKITVNQIKLF